MTFDIDTYNKLQVISRNRSVEHSLIRWKGDSFESAFLRYIADEAKKYVYIYCKNTVDKEQLQLDDFLKIINARRQAPVTVKVIVISEVHHPEFHHDGIIVSRNQLTVNTNVSKSHFIISDDKVFGMKLKDDEWVASFNADKTVQAMKSFFDDNFNIK